MKTLLILLTLILTATAHAGTRGGFLKEVGPNESLLFAEGRVFQLQDVQYGPRQFSDSSPEFREVEILEGADLIFNHLEKLVSKKISSSLLDVQINALGISCQRLVFEPATCRLRQYHDGATESFPYDAPKQKVRFTVTNTDLIFNEISLSPEILDLQEQLIDLHFSQEIQIYNCLKKQDCPILRY